MIFVVLSVCLVGLVIHSEARYQVIPYSLFLTAMKMLYMMCVVLSVTLGGLVSHNEAWHQAIPYSLYLTAMTMMYMVCVVLSVWLGGLVSHSEACTCTEPPDHFVDQICDTCGMYTNLSVILTLVVGLVSRCYPHFLV